MTTNWRDNLTDLPDDVNKADVLFAWTVEESVRANRMDDVAEAYVVESNPMASCGIIVWAKYHGKWEANPFSTRAIVRKLIDLITPPAEPVPVANIQTAESLGKPPKDYYAVLFDLDVTWRDDIDSALDVARKTIAECRQNCLRDGVWDGWIDDSVGDITIVKVTHRAVIVNPEAHYSLHEYEMRPVREPAEPVPPSDIAKYEAELAKCADIVQRHHPIGAVKGIGLMEVATGLEELMQDLAGRRRDAERWRKLSKQHWSDDDNALNDPIVVRASDVSPGAMSYSGERLAAAVDALPDPATPKDAKQVATELSDFFLQNGNYDK